MKQFLTCMLYGAIMCCAVSARATAPSVSSLPVLDATGTRHLRGGDYPAALRALDSASTVTDSCYHLLKLGVASLHTRQFNRSLTALRAVASRCPALAACAYEHIAAIEIELDRADHVLAAYRSALSQPLPQNYQDSLRAQVAEFVQARGIDPAAHDWLSPWYRPAPPKTDSAQRALIDEYLLEQRWAALDSLIGIALDADTKRETCNLLTTIPLDSVPEAAIATARLFEAAARLRSCGKARFAATWLARAAARADFAQSVNTARAEYLRGMLAYTLGDHNEALKWLRRYERDNKPTPEVVITIARAYRALGRGAKAGEWYDKHIQIFPGTNQTQQIIWYRAWQREEQGQLRTAITLYRRIRQQYRSGSLAPESFFREGLLYLRLDRADSALITWNALIKAHPQSSSATAARYWKARALLALQRPERARESLRDVIVYDPLNYYSYRAQDQLRQMGDSGAITHFLPHTDIERARRWLDSIGDAKALSSADSTLYRTGTLLASAGLRRHAEFYLRPLLLSYTTNIAFQFELASMLLFCDIPTLSYRAALPLGWRIPQEHRRTLPLSVLTVLYPASFRNIIDTTATRFSVEPNLISAIVRQESIFDPHIVSAAGAIGLMQIMPFTGEDLARKLHEPFTPDSLYNAVVNVRYGCYYVRLLLDRFDGNIVLTLAGYNGGPHNARRWHEANKDVDFDTFIENISYTETRGYVKRVLANYWTYNRMAGYGHGPMPAQ